MITVKILIDHVGEYMAGDIITDAPAGLVHMATVGTRNAATGQLVAEIVSGSESSNVSEEIAILSELTDKAISLGISDAASLSMTGLISAITKVEFDLLEKEKSDSILLEKQKADKDAAEIAELAELKDKAKELKISGYTKMNIDELKAAIAGGVADGK